jgi:hypothetical protein
MEQTFDVFDNDRKLNKLPINKTIAKLFSFVFFVFNGYFVTIKTHSQNGH